MSSDQTPLGVAGRPAGQRGWLGQCVRAARQLSPPATGALVAMLGASALGASALGGCRSPSSADALAERQPASAKQTEQTEPDRASAKAVRSVISAAGLHPLPTASAAVVLDPRVYDGGVPAPSSASGKSPRGAAPGSAQAAPAATAPKRRYVVAAMGDSLTDPRSGGGKYLKYLAKRCPQSRVKSHGKGGELVNQMRRRFLADVINDAAPPEGQPYTDVIVFGGVNDLYSDLTAGRTVAKISDDLAKMYTMAKGAGLRVTAVTVTPWGGFTRYFNPKRAATTLELNGWIEEQARKGFIDHAVDAYPLLSCGNPQRLCPDYSAPFNDGLHFGPKGHAVLGQALFEAAFSDCA